MTKTECANIYFHGNKISGPNRWFDKSMQFLCQSNGKLGFMGEHSMVDGMPVVALCNHIKQLQYESLRSTSHEKEEGNRVGAKLPVIQNIFEDALCALNSEDSKTIEKRLDKGTYEVLFPLIVICD